MSKHGIIGANVMDRLVKCPGSLKLGNGSLASHDKQNKGYTHNCIEDNESVKFGLIVDELAKDYYRHKVGLPSKKKYFAKLEHELNPVYNEPAIKYANHLQKIGKKLGEGIVDPVYDLSRYMKNLDNCEFRVQFNPDFVAMSYMKRGIAFVSDLSTAKTDDRNKMFQVICCAIGVIKYNPEITDCICEVYNSTSETVQVTKLSREELEAYRDDVILPALSSVSSALESEDVEEYRHKCSWCNHFCILKYDGCKACNSEDRLVDNIVDIDLEFNLNNMSEEITRAYCNLFN